MLQSFVKQSPAESSANVVMKCLEHTRVCCNEITMLQKEMKGKLRGLYQDQVRECRKEDKQGLHQETTMDLVRREHFLEGKVGTGRPDPPAVNPKACLPFLDGKGRK